MQDTGMHGKHVCMLWEEPYLLSAVPPTENFFRRQVLRLRALTLPCEWHHGTALLIRSLKRLRLEQERQSESTFIWHPFSPLKFYWDCFHLFMLFAAFMYMPVQVFITCPPRPDPFILLTDSLMFINIITFFRTGYIIDNNSVVLDPKKIAKHYAKTHLIFDVIGTLPLQYCYKSSYCVHPSHTAMFIFKLFRISSLCRQWKNVVGQMQLSYINYMVLKIIVMSLMFFHWMTYLHYQIPSLVYEIHKPPESMESWLAHFHITNFTKHSVFQKYTMNLYLVCGLCIGAGYYMPLDHHFIPELMMVACMGLVGLVFVMYTFSALLRLAVYRQYESYIYVGKYRQLEEYMGLQRMPTHLRKMFKLFIDYKFNNNFFNEEEIMNTINEQIKQDINMFSCKMLVMNVPLFQDMPTALINAIVFNLKQALYMPGQTIVNYGEPGSSIMLISAGTVAVIDESGKEVAHLCDGAFFGEVALCEPGATRTATVIALEITQIYTLENEQFVACLQPYPHRKRRLDDLRSAHGSNLSK